MKRLPRDLVQKMCTGKRRYASAGEALQAAALLGLERQRQAYVCAVCGHWHLSTRRQPGSPR